MGMVWFIAAALSLLFWGFCAFSLGGALAGWSSYQDQYGVELFTWIQGFPLWRDAIWGASIALGLLGSLLMFARVRLAGDVLFGAFVLLAAGFAYDLALDGGMLNLGRKGLLASSILMGLAGLSALAGYASAGKANTLAKSKQSAASSDAVASAAASAQAPTPAPSTAPTPKASAPPRYTATLAEAPATDQDDLGASAEPVPETITPIPEAEALTASGPASEPLLGAPANDQADLGAAPAPVADAIAANEEADQPASKAASESMPDDAVVAAARPSEASFEAPSPAPAAPAPEETSPPADTHLPEASANDQDGQDAPPESVDEAKNLNP